MAEPQPAPRVQPFVALLSQPGSVRGEAAELLQAAFSPIVYTGAPHPFDVSDGYAAEMGKGLERMLLAFQNLAPADFLPQAKLACNGIEEQLRHQGRRRANLDVGYLDADKLVLASCQPAPHRLYLGQRVWAEIAQLDEGLGLHPLPWAFADFGDARFQQELGVLRELYAEKLVEDRK